MGNYQSAVTRQTLSSLTEVMNSVMQNSYNDAIARCTSQNVLSIETCPETVFIRGSIGGNQKAVSKCQQFANIENEVNANFNSVVVSTITDFINTDLRNEQGFFSTALSIATSEVDTVAKIVNRIINTFQQDVRNTCSVEVSAFNQSIIRLCGYYEDTNVGGTQDALSLALSSCVMRNMLDAVTNDSVLNNLIVETDTLLASRQQGFGGVLMWIAIIGGIVLLLLIIGLVIWFFLSQGSGGSTTQIYAGSTQPSIGTGPLGAYQFAQTLL